MEQTRGNDIAERMIDFAVSIMSLLELLPKNETAMLIKNQILRSSTSVGANYEEARGAESSADFIHKLGIVSKELKETRYWLKLMIRWSALSRPKIF